MHSGRPSHSEGLSHSKTVNDWERIREKKFIHYDVNAYQPCALSRLERSALAESAGRAGLEQYFCESLRIVLFLEDEHTFTRPFWRSNERK
jgi:hypothetical protein